MNENESMEIDYAAFGEGFGDDGYQTDEADTSDVAQHEAAEAPVSKENADGETTPETEENPAEAKEEAGKPTAEETPEQMFTLKVNKEERKVNLADMTALAQKGADYDRVKGQVADLQAFKMEYSDMAAIIKSVAEANGKTVADVVKEFRLNMAKSTGLSEEAATERIAREDAERERDALKEQQTAQEQKTEDNTARAQREFAEFRGKFPDVVLDKKTLDALTPLIGDGKTLTEAYLEHKNTELADKLNELEKQVKASEQASKNRSRSTGSMRDSGATSKTEYDDFWGKFN